MSEFPRRQYLAKIRLSQAPALTEAGLHELHRAQVFAVPFENIEPFLGRPVPLGFPDFYAKFLDRHRGGYCFELNRFFGAALEHFGFSNRRALGRVFMGRPQAGARTHYVNLVELNGRTWLADVGFGGPGLVDPIPFEAGYEGEQYGRKVRLRQDADWGLMLEDFFEGSWRTMYAIPDEKVVDPDVLSGNHFCATHPDSIFRQNLFCSLPSKDGRVTIWNRSVHIHTAAGREEKIMHGAPEIAWVFRELLRMPLAQEDIVALDRKLAPHDPAGKNPT